MASERIGHDSQGNLQEVTLLDAVVPEANSESEKPSIVAPEESEKPSIAAPEESEKAVND
jgi:hypothetical protein